MTSESRYVSTTIEQVDGVWTAESPMGPITIAFAPRNDFGVLDHDVTDAAGETFHNPMRVIGNDDGCDVVFTVRRRAGLTDAEFARDAAAVQEDLDRLKQLMERQ